MDKTIEKIERLNLALLGFGALIGWGMGIGHAPSLLLGGGVMHANFWLLKKIVRSLLAHPEDNGGAKARAAFWFLAKGLLFFALLSALLIRYPVDGPSFACGVSLLLVACVIVSLAGNSS